MPTGTYTVGDVLVLVATATTSTSDITLSGGTGTWTIYPGTGTDPGGNYTWSTNSHMIVATHIFANGDTAPTLNATGTTPAFAWIMCPYWGVDTTTPIEAEKSTATSASATVSFPTITPSSANDELFLLGAGKFGATPTYSSVSTTTTGANCTGGGKTTDQVFIKSVTTSSPDLTWYQQNQGPCSPAATSAASIVASASGDNIGVAVLLKSAAFASIVTRSPKIANLAGVADFNTLGQGRTSIDPADFQPFVDLITAYANWIDIEPNNCDEYNFDWVDNAIINARILGKKVTLAMSAGTRTPCGGTNEASCTGFTDGSVTPAWAYTSTACDGSVVPGFITSMWVDSNSGPPLGNAELILDPNNVAYQTELDRAIGDLGHRWGAISNVAGMYIPGLNLENPINALNQGADGASYTCNGSSAQCTAICGAASCSRTLADAAQWLALTPQGGGSYGTALSGSCGGGAANQSWVVCDMEAGYKHFAATIHSDFPNVVLMSGRTPGLHGATGASPAGTHTSTDPFNNDTFAYDAATYPGSSLELDSSMGCNTNCNNLWPSYVTSNTTQPLNGVGFQEVSPQANVTAGAVCNNGFGGYAYSFSASNCVPVTVYGMMQASMYPYLEVYKSDLDSSPSQPWWVLLHQFVAK